MLIWDDAAQRLAYADRLTAARFKVVCGGNGEEGLPLIRAERPDLIISDLVMPGWDGYRVLSEVRADPRLAPTRILFLTALGDGKQIRRGMNLGVDDYLTKPVLGEDLLAAVRVQIEKGRQARAAVERGTAKSLGGVETVLKDLHNAFAATVAGVALEEGSRVGTSRN